MLYPIIIGVSLSIGMIVGLYFGLSARPVAEKPPAKKNAQEDMKERAWRQHFANGIFDPMNEQLHHPYSPLTPYRAMGEIFKHGKRVERENKYFEYQVFFNVQEMESISEFEITLVRLLDYYFEKDGYYINISGYRFGVTLNLHKLKYNINLL